MFSILTRNFRTPEEIARIRDEQGRRKQDALREKQERQERHWNKNPPNREMTEEQKYNQRGKKWKTSKISDPLEKRLSQLSLEEKLRQKRHFFETDEPDKVVGNPKFQALYEVFMTHCATAEQELNLHEELDDGNVEYKLKFDSPTMARVEHLTTQMHFRLNEGHGLAFYQIGVLDSGQVTGLQDNEILETLIILFHMSTTLQYGATLSIEKVRVGVEGFSVMLKVVRTNPAG